MHEVERWHLYLLGGLAAERGEGEEKQRVIDFGGRKPAEFLAWLAFHTRRERPQPLLAEQVIEKFWPIAGRVNRNAELRARNSLDAAVGTIRRVLPGGATKQGVIIRTAGTLRLDSAYVRVDTDEISLLLAAAKTASTMLQEQHFLREALAWYGTTPGILLAGFDENAYNDVRYYYQTQYVETACKLGELFAQTHELNEAQRYGGYAFAADPTSERASVLLIHIFLAQNLKHKALEQYKAFERALDKEGDAPSEAVQNLVRNLREGKRVVWPYRDETPVKLLVSSAVPETSMARQPVLQGKHSKGISSLEEGAPAEWTELLQQIIHLRDQGLPQSAIAQAQAHLHDTSYPLPRAHLLFLIGNALRDLGEMEAALERYQEAYEQALRGKNAQLAAEVQAKIALTYHQTGQFEAAATLGERVLETAQQNKWLHIEIAARSLKAYLLENSGQIEAALGQLKTALKASHQTQLIGQQITVLSDIARMYGLQGAYSEALAALEQSSELARDNGLSRNIYENQHREAWLQHSIGNRSSAKKLLEELRQKASIHKLNRLEVEVTHSLAKFAMQETQFEQALSLLTEAENTAQTHGLARTIRFIQLDRAYTLAMMGDQQDAMQTYLALWSSLLPLQLTHLEIVAQWLPRVESLLPAEEQAKMHQLSQRAQELRRPASIFDAVQQLERQRFLSELPETIKALVEGERTEVNGATPHPSQ